MLPDMTTHGNLLLVEDDAALARGLIEGLTCEYFHVAHQSTGEGAIAHARLNAPHAVILDVRLPDISGFDVCRRLRQLGLRMPILMLTAHGDEADKVLGLELGADDYVTKPCSIRELTSRVRALLRRAYGEFAGDTASVMQAGDVRIDLNRTRVSRGDTLIDLTPIEYKLLVFLARHAGQSLSRAQLVENVWGYAADLDSERTVNVTVNRLRQKIERDPGNPALILTVPGVGYRMIDAGR